MTLAHSAGTTPAMPLQAMAPPVTPAMSMWLLEAGMPMNQQQMPQAMAATMPAKTASRAACVSVPKFTIPNIVCATAVEM